jgi:hypothetical protein
MNNQEREMIIDVNAKRKEQAMDKMRLKAYNNEQETLMKELSRLNQHSNEVKETNETLKIQMNLKKQRYQSAQIEDQTYKTHVEKTLNMLGERDKMIEEQRKKTRISLGKELQNQIREHNEINRKMYNEMDERDITLNQKGLVAYEIGDRSAGLFKLPGVDREPLDDREYFGRYNKKEEPSKLGAQLAMSHIGGYDGNSRGGSIKPFSRRDFKNSPSEHDIYTKKNSEDSGEYNVRGRRASRGINQPSQNSNILGQPSSGDETRSLRRHRSLLSIPLMDQTTKSPPLVSIDKGIGLIPRKISKSPPPMKLEEPPAYEPMVRKPSEKRDFHLFKSRRLSSDMSKVDEAKHVATNPPVETTYSRALKINKNRQAPTSLQDINRRLDQRVVGSLRAGNLGISTNNYHYDKDGNGTYRAFSSMLN